MPEMELFTPRLRIIPLNAGLLAALLRSGDDFDAELGLARSESDLVGHEREAMQWLHDQAVCHPDQFPWYARWQIILREENRSVGSACFKGPPDHGGEVEMGYGIEEAHRNRGYMTEAARALCDWALKQPGVRCVLAVTDELNIPSHKVCGNCGMTLSGKMADGLPWRRYA